ncbi:hypothetical protein ARMGADRAFT_1031114 [Armillaria gallica]|uniref:Uncharacterized protein n=1 Tax=Armillaria gallica TaxID=47427 RepID=A0A2H3DEK1_ARMGA|nr:hypothetical protein ARMGADRAFT_1031114 [Armillaria gallica]
MLDRGAQRHLTPAALVLTRLQITNAIYVKRCRISCQSRDYAVYPKVLALPLASCYPQSRLPFASTVKETRECVQSSVSAIRKFNVHMVFFRISLRGTYQKDGNESMRGTAIRLLNFRYEDGSGLADKAAEPSVDALSRPVTVVEPKVALEYEHGLNNMLLFINAKEREEAFCLLPSVAPQVVAIHIYLFHTPTPSSHSHICQHSLLDTIGRLLEDSEGKDLENDQQSAAA